LSIHGHRRPWLLPAAIPGKEVAEALMKFGVVTGRADARPGWRIRMARTAPDSPLPDILSFAAFVHRWTTGKLGLTAKLR